MKVVYYFGICMLLSGLIMLGAQQKCTETSGATPVLLTSFFVEECGIQSLKVQGNTAFTACSGGSIQSIDITDPAHPQFLASSNLIRTLPKDISIDGTYLYTFSKVRNLAISYLEIFDISDPSSLQPVGNLTLNDANAISMALKDHTLYIYEDFNEKVLVIDVSDPTNPIQRGFVQMTFIVHNMYIHENLALLANAGLGLSVLDITNPFEPVLLPRFAIEKGVIWDVTAKEEYVFLVRGVSPSEDFGEFLVLDASDPSQMELVASFVIETPRNTSSPHSIALEGNLVAMALQGSPSNLVVLIDISDPTSPKEQGNAEIPEELASVQGGIVIQNGLIYVAANRGIAIYEIVYQ